MNSAFIFNIILGVFIGIILSDYLKYKNAYLFLDKFINKTFLCVKLFLLNQKKKIFFFFFTLLSFTIVLFIYTYQIKASNEQKFEELREKNIRQLKEKQISFCEKVKKINTKEFSIDYCGSCYCKFPRFWKEKKYRDDRRYYEKILEEALSDIRYNATPPYYNEYYDCFDLEDIEGISWKKGIEIICK